MISICMCASLNKLLSIPVEGAGDGDRDCVSRIRNTNKINYIVIVKLIMQAILEYLLKSWVKFSKE